MYTFQNLTLLGGRSSVRHSTASSSPTRDLPRFVGRTRDRPTPRYTKNLQVTFQTFISKNCYACVGVSNAGEGGQPAVLPSWGGLIDNDEHINGLLISQEDIKNMGNPLYWAELPV
jgi:hypothetical protein